MDPETGSGLPSTGQKARLLIGKALWFWNSIGRILAAAVRQLAWVGWDLSTEAQLTRVNYA